jgi:ammonia channel protein AmtB
MIIKESGSTGRIHLEIEKRIEAHEEFKSNNLGMVVVGTLLVWICYLFFIGGKVSSMFESRFEGQAKMFLLVLLAGASGCLSVCILKPFFGAPPNYKTNCSFDI